MRATIAPIAIAWVLARGTDIVSVIGARRTEMFQESAAAVHITLSAEDGDVRDGAFPEGVAAGT